MKAEKAILDVEELDVQIRTVPLAIDAIISSLDAATLGLANGTTRQQDPTDRASLLASAERARQAARSCFSAGERLLGQAALLEAAGLVAYHRAPLPKRPARRRR